MAEIFKTKKATISRYETGTRDPKLDTLMEFADCFKVSTNICWDGKPEEVVEINKF